MSQWDEFSPVGSGPITREMTYPWRHRTATATAYNWSDQHVEAASRARRVIWQDASQQASVRESNNRLSRVRAAM